MSDFFSFSKRIDPKIKYKISIKGVRTIPLILQLNHSIDNPIKRKLTKLGFKIKYEINFLKCICGSLPSRNFDSLKAFVEIKKVYYDDKAMLMGKIFPYSDSINLPIQTKSQLLNGRDISIGFIDTGVYPHAAFVSPRKRILAFKDFIQDKKEPYDDSGHGTAAIAASSLPASDSGIVCAKAFDMSDHGFYSDIIASMDWILEVKDKLKVKIIVLNFGTMINNSHFDLLTLAAEALWKNGLLVVACAGNLGPESATITSPGHSQKLLTIGAFSKEREKSVVVSWSGRGPTGENIDKPDLAMPGYLVPAMSNKTGSMVSFTGTSASASLASGFAALLYEKKPSITPDDAKSLLKLCSASFGELKQAQGKGYIDVKKIEEA